MNQTRESARMGGLAEEEPGGERSEIHNSSCEFLMKETNGEMTTEKVMRNRECCVVREEGFELKEEKEKNH